VTGTQATSDHRIVVGVDGSDCSLAALDWAARQAKLTGATLEAVITWEWPTTYGAAFSFLPANYDPSADARTVLDQALKALGETYRDVEVRSVVVEGHPAPALVDASRGADLLVVGSRGHGEFSGMLLGSVSQHCATNARCPVLVLHERT